MEIEIIEGFEDFEDAVADICFPDRKKRTYRELSREKVP
jgi:hypothetical protein